MKRYLEKHVREDLAQKMVFLAGPRQCGKTTLGQTILGNQPSRYLNWDDDEDRQKILKKTFPAEPGLLVLDEIHKFARWRQLLKGLYDKRKQELQILVMGSAKLDYYRRGGDSLQGRYNMLRLHPLTLAELENPTAKTLEDLLTFGGFPEPFLKGSEREARRWSEQYKTRVIREELSELEQVKELSLLELLFSRLPDCVGSPLSINALREDLQVSHQAVSRWLTLFERLYLIFRIYPFGAPLIRAVKKEAKHYHFDWTLVEDPGARFENLVACHLLKWCHYMQDVGGWEMDLRYFRDVDKREVDFVILKKRKPIFFIETKLSAKSVSPHLTYLKERFPDVESIQLVFSENVDVKDSKGIRLTQAPQFLKTLV
jgi:predicted AAA+ superfamily ATPase